MKHKNTRKRTIRRNGLRLNGKNLGINSRREYASNSFSRRAGIPASMVGQLIPGRKTLSENESANSSEGKVKRTALRLVPKLSERVEENLIKPEEEPIPKGNNGNGGGSRWNNPRTSGIVAAILLLAMLVTAALSSARSVRADDEPAESLNVYAAEPAAQTATLKLAKEYIYAGSRMLAIEDYGLSNSTPTPTPTPTATPTPPTNNASPAGQIEGIINSTQTQYLFGSGATTLGFTNSADQTIFVTGWTFDPDDSSTSNTVKIYVDGDSSTGTLIGTVTTNLERPDINQSNSITGSHGFYFQIPSQYSDGNQHTLYVYGIDLGSNNPTLLGNTFNYFQSIPLSPPSVTTPGGYVDTVSCFTFSGWAYDYSNTTTRVEVSVYIDGQHYMDTIADQPRPDLAAANVGDGIYAWQVLVPASIQDGQPHTITAKVNGTALSIYGSNQVTCTAP